jgi:hypothetical protein
MSLGGLWRHRKVVPVKLNDRVSGQEVWFIVEWRLA